MSISGIFGFETKTKKAHIYLPYNADIDSLGRDSLNYIVKTSAFEMETYLAGMKVESQNRTEFLEDDNKRFYLHLSEVLMMKQFDVLWDDLTDLLKSNDLNYAFLLNLDKNIFEMYMDSTLIDNEFPSGKYVKRVNVSNREFANVGMELMCEIPFSKINSESVDGFVLEMKSLHAKIDYMSYLINC